MIKLSLPDVTLITVDCVYMGSTKAAMDACLAVCEFGAAKFLSSEDAPGVTHKIKLLDSSRKYSWFVMKELWKFVDTKFMLIFQHDGFVLNTGAWDPGFLDYDYIGAPLSWSSMGMTNGNGGFSLRSRRLMEEVAVAAAAWNNFNIDVHPEDYFICESAAPKLRESGLRFAPVDMAARFACGRGRWDGEFGFHGVLTDISGWDGHAAFLAGRKVWRRPGLVTGPAAVAGLPWDGVS